MRRTDGMGDLFLRVLGVMKIENSDSKFVTRKNRKAEKKNRKTDRRENLNIEKFKSSRNLEIRNAY